MSDAEEPLFADLTNILNAAQHAVDLEEMSVSMLKIAFILVTFRKYMIEAKFSEQWVEDACMVLWKKWFGRNWEDDDE